MGSLTSKCLATRPIVVCQSRGVHRRMGDCPTEKAGFNTFGNSIVIVRRELADWDFEGPGFVQSQKGIAKVGACPLQLYVRLRASLRLFLDN